MKKILLLLCSISLLASCAANNGVSGKVGDQIKGKKLSVQAFYMNPDKTPKEIPTINVRNETDQNFAIMPIKITAWFKAAGKKEKTLNAGTLAASGQIPPHKEIMLASEIFKFDVAASDQLNKLTLAFGPDGSGQEVFTINP